MRVKSRNFRMGDGGFVAAWFAYEKDMRTMQSPQLSRALPLKIKTK